MRKRLKNHFIPHQGNDYKPHFVRERNIVGLALLSVAIFGLAFSIKNLITRNPGLLSAVITSVLVDLTNNNRTTEHLAALTPNEVLAAAAQKKADDMAAKGYFAHNSPDGKTPWYWFTQEGYQFLYAGENLAVNFVDSEDVVLAWMNSAGHRANIMNGKFTEIGIAMASGIYNGKETIYVVQLFGNPAPTQVAPRPVVTTTTTNNQPLTTNENIEVLSESEMFVAVKNSDFMEATSAIASANVPGLAQPQSSFLDRALASPKMLLKTFYELIGAIVLVGLLLFVSFKRKNQHNKHVVYVVLLLVLIVVLFYLSSARLFPQILVE